MAVVFHADCISAIPAVRGKRQSPVTCSSRCTFAVTNVRNTPVSHSLNSSLRSHRHHRAVDRCQDVGVRCSASNDAPPPVYKGMYGDWSVEDSDKLEVHSHLNTNSVEMEPLHHVSYGRKFVAWKIHITFMLCGM